MNIKVTNKSKHALPEYETLMSAGMDLRANIESQIILNPGERCLVPTGIRIQLPKGYEAQVRPRSGLAIKKGIYVHLGTIDSDYRGDVGVIIFNLGKEPFEINDGDRIAQMIIAKYEQAEWVEVDSLDETERGVNGFGSTGKK